MALSEKEAALLTKALAVIDRCMSDEPRDTDVAALLQDGTAKHVYFYSPFEDADIKRAQEAKRRAIQMGGVAGPDVIAAAVAAAHVAPTAPGVNGGAGAGGAGGDAASQSPWLPQLIQLTGGRRIPRRILERIPRVAVTWSMGLFPEIHRAWIILDNDLLIWDYEAPEAPGMDMGVDDEEDPYGELHTPGLLSFRDFEFPIVSVGLVVPNADLFEVSARADAAAKYLLVVCTTGKVELLALMFDKHSVHGTLSFQHLDFVFPTDGISFKKVAGTWNGRILLAGSDGCVHELDLGAAATAASGRGGARGAVEAVASGVMSGLARLGGALGVAGAEPLAKRVKRVNHDQTVVTSMLKVLLGTTGAQGYPLIDLTVDHERNLAYTLGQDGSIRMYSLGPFCTQFELVATIADIEQAANLFCGGKDPLNAPNQSVFTPGKGARECRREQAGDRGMGWPIISLTVVPVSESRKVHLIATAQSGTRFYFTTYTLPRYGAPGTQHAAAAAAIGPDQYPGRTLTLVYIRLPPTAPFIEDYCDLREGARPGFDPNQADKTAVYTHDPLVSTSTALLPMRKIVGAGEHLVALTRDYLLRRRTPDEACWLRFHEDVLDLPVSGYVYAMGEVLPTPTIWRDTLFTPSGAMLLRDGETAPVPGNTTAVRTGKDCTTDTASALPTAIRLSGVRRPREDPYRPAAITTAPMVGAVVPQDSLNNSGVLQQYHHLVRRRLWDAAAGSDTISDYALQHDPAATAHTFTVMTNSSVVKLKRVRPIDQFGRMLAQVRFPESLAAHRRLPGFKLGSSSVPAIDDFLSRVPEGEGMSMCIAIACGALDPATLSATVTGGVGGGGVPGYMPPAVDALMSGQADGAGATASLAALITKNADRLFDLYRTEPSFEEGAMELDENQLIFSPAVYGLLFYLPRLLRPVWSFTAFIKPPELPRGSTAVSAASGAAFLAAMKAPDDVKPDEKLLLPRFTAEEMLDLAAKLKTLEDFITRHFPELQRGMADLPRLAQRVAWSDVLGLPRVPEPGGAGAGAGGSGSAGSSTSAYGVSDQEKALRARVLEFLHVVLIYRLTKRAAEAAHLLAAMADPSFGAANVLTKLGSATTSPSGLKLTVPDGDLRRLATTTKFSDIVSKQDGMRLCDGLCSRMLAALHAKSFALPDAAAAEAGIAPRANGGAGGADSSLSGAVFSNDPAWRLASTLRDKCPSFFSEASQLLEAARTLAEAGDKTTNSGDRSDLLQRSLREAIKAVTIWTVEEMDAQLPRLADLARAWRKLGFASGAIVALLAAAAQAAGGVAKLDTLPDDAPTGDLPPAAVAPAPAPAPVNAVLSPAARRRDDAIADVAPAGPVISKPTLLRMECYNVVMEILGGALQGGGGAALAASAGPGVAAAIPVAAAALADSLAGRIADFMATQTPAFRSRLGVSGVGLGSSLMGGGGGGGGDADGSTRVFDALLADALRSRDAFFHDCLYRWLINQGRRDQLLRIESDFLEAFLRDRCTDESLLISYYVSRGGFAKAARIQHDRALDARTPLDLDSRLRFLEQAVQLARRSEAVQLSGAVPAGITESWEHHLRHFRAQAEVRDALARRLNQCRSEIQVINVRIQVWRTEARDCSQLEADLRDVEAEATELAKAVTELSTKPDIRVQDLLRKYANQFGQVQCFIPILDVDRNPASKPVVVRAYSKMMLDTVGGVVDGSLDHLPYVRPAVWDPVYGGGAAAAAAAAQAREVPMHRRNVHSYLLALQLLVSDMVRRYGHSSFAFPVAELVYELEGTVAMNGEVGWDLEVEPDEPFDYTWLSVKTLATGDILSWSDRFTAYMLCTERAFEDGRPKLQLYFLMAASAFMRAWADAVPSLDAPGVTAFNDAARRFLQWVRRRALPQWNSLNSLGNQGQLHDFAAGVHRALTDAERAVTDAQRRLMHLRF